MTYKFSFLKIEWFIVNDECAFVIFSWDKYTCLRFSVHDNIITIRIMNYKK